MLSPSQYATKLATDLTKITMADFFKSIHGKFYQDQDISFMEYFLELCEHDGEFYIHHNKLIEYGIMTSTESSKIKDKLKNLNLVESSDYVLADIRENSENGGRPSKVYYLTSEAFKKCLMRARRYKGQPIDPVIYCDYYLLLEKVHKLYTDYERLYSNKLISMKDDKINELISEVKYQSKEIAELKSMNVDQSRNIDRLMVYAEDSNTKITDLKETVENMFQFILSFARVTLKTWYGSSVMDSQLNNLVKEKSLNFALKHMKVMFTVGFYINNDNGSKLKIYFCCTNFADVGKRIKELYIRHSNQEYNMLLPNAITLISCEINTERVILSRMDSIFPPNTTPEYSNTHKSFDLIVDHDYFEEVSDCYKKIVSNARNERFQLYQQRMDDYVNANSFNSEVLNHMYQADELFYNESRPFCQKYINRYVTRVYDAYNCVIGFKYIARDSNKEVKPREDLNNKKINNLVYPLHKIKFIIDEHSQCDRFEEMVRGGIISKKDIGSFKKIALIENIDVSHLCEPTE